MQVLDSASLSSLLSTLDMPDLSESQPLRDTLLTAQRVVQQRLCGRGSGAAGLRSAALLELACRRCGLRCPPRDRLLSAMGLSVSLTDFRRELVVCEAALGWTTSVSVGGSASSSSSSSSSGSSSSSSNGGATVNSSSSGTGTANGLSVLMSALSVKYGEDEMVQVQRAMDDVLHRYREALPIQQRVHIAENTVSLIQSSIHQNPAFIAGIIALASQEVKVNIPSNDLLKLLDCSKQEFNKISQKLRRAGATQTTINDKTVIIPTQQKKFKDVQISAPKINSRNSYKAAQQLCAATASSGSSQLKDLEETLVSENPEKEVLLINPVKSEDLSRKRTAYEAWKSDQLLKRTT